MNRTLDVAVGGAGLTVASSALAVAAIAVEVGNGPVVHTGDWQGGDGG